MTPCTNSPRSVVLPLGVAEAGEIEQLFRDFLAAESLALDHLQVVGDDLLLLARQRLAGGGRGEQLADAAFQRLGAHGDRGQRVVDLVGDAGRQEAHARQLLAPHHLLGALLHLAVQVVADVLESRASCRSSPRPARRSRRGYPCGCDNRSFRRPPRRDPQTRICSGWKIQR